MWFSAVLRVAQLSAGAEEWPGTGAQDALVLMLAVAALVTPSCMGDQQFPPSRQCILVALLLLVVFLLLGFYDEKLEPRQHVGVKGKEVHHGFGGRVWRRVAKLCAVLNKKKAKEKRVLFFFYDADNAFSSSWC